MASATRLGTEAARLSSEYLHKIDTVVASLAPTQVWWRANERSKSIGNLLLHLDGNLSQWVLVGLGNEEHGRQRAAEFAAREGAPAEELLADLQSVVQQCLAVAESINDEALRKDYEIQGYRRDGFAVLLHAVEHMSYHTGQIVLLAKQLAPDAGIEFNPHLAGR